MIFQKQKAKEINKKIDSIKAHVENGDISSVQIDFDNLKPELRNMLKKDKYNSNKGHLVRLIISVLDQRISSMKEDPRECIKAYLSFESVIDNIKYLLAEQNRLYS